MDSKKLKELQWKVFQNVAAAQLVPLMRIGDELKLFTTLANLGPSKNNDFAKAAEIDARYSGYLARQEQQIQRVIVCPRWGYYLRIRAIRCVDCSAC